MLLAVTCDLMTAILDHLAIGMPALSDGWELFGGVLGGTRGGRSGVRERVQIPEPPLPVHVEACSDFQLCG
jgi:hypothetical protein